MLKLVPSLKVVAMAATGPITRLVRNRSTVDGAPLRGTNATLAVTCFIDYLFAVNFVNRSLKMASLFNEVAILIKWRALSLYIRHPIGEYGAMLSLLAPMRD